MKDSRYWRGWKDCASDLLDVALEAGVTADFSKQIRDYIEFADKKLESADGSKDRDG